ncbi:MAG: LLM class flavin-dependent oxidoreductase [Thaumarchaeota archaeon]|nr:LLM class flavin-dependent oxidoreductase [Nitrososphaerota archaeon]
MRLRFGYRLDLRDPAKVLEYAVGADMTGFDYAWVPDHVTAGSPKQVCFDAWLFLASAGAKTTRIKLGPSVSDIVRRDPVMLAQSAATLGLLTGGRCVLGLGLGEAMNLLPFGLKPSRQTARMKEAIEVIRLLWTSSFDNRVSYSGRFYNFEGGWLQFPGAKEAPIYIGALGPKNQRLAGEVADGWFPAIHTNGVFAQSVKNLRAGLEKARRKADSLDIVARFYIAITDDIEEGLRRVGPAARNMLLSEQRSLDEKGVLTDEMGAFSAHSMVPGSGDWGKKQQEALGKIPDEVVEAVTLVGTPNMIAEKISEFRKMGATQVVIQDPTDGVIQTQRDFMSRVAPLLS